MELFSVKFLIFLILVTALYFAVPLKKRWLVLLAGSCCFYILGAGWKALLFILATTFSTFFTARKLTDMQEESRQAAGAAGEGENAARLRDGISGKRRNLMLICLLFNFGILIVMKYGGMFLKDAGIIMPLGISFYTFQTMGYLIDVYRNKYPADVSLPRFALFTTYFPQIIQGPIGRHDHLALQLEEGHKWDDIRFREGVLRLLWGYFKKMIIAERAAILVNEVFSNYAAAGYNGFIIFIGGLIYGFQIYADFSGGMDIIMGVSHILGIQLTENFRQPFFAISVAEFWQRWHITLGGWMKDYVFYPICLSKRAARLQRKFKKKYGNYYGRVMVPTFASFTAFLLVGIWHGAEWKFVAYGVFMAALVASNTFFERTYTDLKKRFKIDDTAISWRLFQILRTTFIVLCGRFFARALTFKDALGMLRAMFTSFNPWVFFDGTLFTLGLDQKNFHLLMALMVFLIAVDYANERGMVIRRKIASAALPVRWIVYYTAIAAVMVFGIYGVGYDASSFIYQNF